MNRIRRLLIANRGEIACRIIRACRAAGVESVAVYSEADRNALHVELADVAAPIGPAPAAQSYLDADRLLEAARLTGADAVHPGYGFLSESAAFAAAVEAAGLVWVGATPACIQAMGDKLNARRIAVGAGVPVLPGVRLEHDAPETLDAAVAGLGFPLLLKAAGGGGGIGMQRIESLEALAQAAPRLRALAQRAFGDSAIYLERFIATARHVEVQVFGDGAGRAIHMAERDCSLQRRYQKIVEEGPAPRLSARLRDALRQAAVRLAEHQRYSGAGTVEFLVDADAEDFFFLEMNTRIQVEHGVTEMVTGQDLVRMQLDCAGGELALPAQHEIRVAGHAVECRLYAEDPARGFRPSPGRLTALRLPEGPDLRVDCGYRGGDEITPFYDPMLAKIIAHGPDREAARRRMIEALEAVEVAGVATNLPFLQALIASDAFASGDVDTRLAERLAQAPHHPAKSSPPVPAGE
ncbi:acetyl/propionyl/methylcrotonyl-CoA carboxylase subunit alpha [Phenylobacterium sp.]|uniref:acetyl-CoA carboxylase biotin carboxylase subunit n=1 Tax=Phenylobacterium sp. TaxID=1871053 RepID=UPI0035AED137